MAISSLKMGNFLTSQANYQLRDGDLIAEIVEDGTVAGSTGNVTLMIGTRTTKFYFRYIADKGLNRAQNDFKKPFIEIEETTTGTTNPQNLGRRVMSMSYLDSGNYSAIMRNLREKNVGFASDSELQAVGIQLGVACPINFTNQTAPYNLVQQSSATMLSYIEAQATNFNEKLLEKYNENSQVLNQVVSKLSNQNAYLPSSTPIFAYDGNGDGKPDAPNYFVMAIGVIFLIALFFGILAFFKSTNKNGK